MLKVFKEMKYNRELDYLIEHTLNTFTTIDLNDLDFFLT